MRYKSFPELNRQQVKHLLRNGVRIEDSDSYLCDTARKLVELDVIEMQEYQYVLCVNSDDPDYVCIVDPNVKTRKS